MIIYGHRATHIGTKEIPLKCSSCGSENTLRISVFSRYAHIFWIPIFPFGKTGASECSNCKQVLQLNEMPPEYKASYNAIKEHTATPKWTFAGLVIIALLIGFAVYSSKQSDKENMARINAPKAGDVYEIKTSESAYTIYKVNSIVDDTVFVYMNEYETNKPSGLSDIKAKGDEAFLQVPIGYSKAELLQMLEKGEIRDVERD